MADLTDLTGLTGLSGRAQRPGPHSSREELAASASTLRVSVDSAGRQGDAHSFVPALSLDGRHVAFASIASNFVTDDTNGVSDVFVHDRRIGVTEHVSVDTNGAQGNADSLGPSISGQGRYVAFRSLATNLVPGDTNGFSDIFVHDRRTGATLRINESPSGAGADGPSSYASITPDGRYVAFESRASNLVAAVDDPFGAFYDVFRHDLQTGSTVLVSVDPPPGGGSFFGDCFEPSISADGRFVTFGGLPSSNLPVDVFVRDLQSGATEQVSVDPSGGDLDLEVGPVLSTSVSSISSDGRYVAFLSRAWDLVSGDANGVADVFLRDRQAGITTRVSVGPAGAESNGESGVTYSPRYLSGDGRLVVFESLADNLVPGDTNDVRDVFVHDVQSGATSRASVSSVGRQGNDLSHRPSISGDGLVVAFEAAASNLVAGDANDSLDVFVREDIPGGLPITSYCHSKANSQGCTPAISSSGVPSLAGSDAFFLTAVNVLNGKRGMLLWAPASASVPFRGGTLCLQERFERTALQHSGGGPAPDDCSGSYSFHFSQAYMASRGLGPGTTLFGQFLGRDPGFAAPDDVELTGGIRFTTCP